MDKFQLAGLISAAADTGSSLRRGELLREKASEKSGAFLFGFGICYKDLDFLTKAKL